MYGFGKTRGGKLSITTQGDRSQVEVAGTPVDIIFNWTALTNQVCKTLGVPPIALAAMLPQMVSEYQGTALKSEMRMGGEVRAVK